MGSTRTGDIRKAVASGEWQAALAHWEAYAAGIREEIRRGACTRSRMAEARNFLDWAGRVVLCARAQAQNQLNAIHAARQYAPSPSRPPSSWRTML